MSDLFSSDVDGSTPLTHEEFESLIPSYITLRNELNSAEQYNIAEAQTWALSRKRNVLDEAFLRRLHKRMFCDVWSWAGIYRTTGKNIGVDAWKISTEMRHLVDDVKYWIEHKTYDIDEIGARFHHKLVWIHPFPNGNGRHARLAADILLVRLGKARFSWGIGNLQSTGKLRAEYIHALQCADKNDFQHLIKFVRA